MSRDVHGGLELYQVDAFTRTPFAGNPAGVVPDARGLSADRMQAIARELNNPETAFILPAVSPWADCLVRYFTPLMEVPSCGHATIAAHYVRAIRLGLGGTRVRQESGAGLLEIEIIPDDGDYRIYMHQRPPEFLGELGAEEIAQLRSALGIGARDLRADLPIEVVSTGHSKVMVPLASDALLQTLSPSMNALAELSRAIGCNGFHVFALREGAVLTSARMFAPAIGIPEDPVTGNGNGPLGAYLVRHGVVSGRNERVEFTAVQGEAMGRPGRVRVRVDTDDDGLPVAVSVGEHAVIVFRAVLAIR